MRGLLLGAAAAAATQPRAVEEFGLVRVDATGRTALTVKDSAGSDFAVCAGVFSALPRANTPAHSSLESGAAGICQRAGFADG